MKRNRIRSFVLAALVALAAVAGLASGPAAPEITGQRLEIEDFSSVASRPGPELAGARTRWGSMF